MSFTKHHRAWRALCILVALLAQLSLMQLALADDDHEREGSRQSEHARAQTVGSPTSPAIQTKRDDDEDENSNEDEDDDDDEGVTTGTGTGTTTGTGTGTGTGTTTGTGTGTTGTGGTGTTGTGTGGTGTTTNPPPAATQAVTIANYQFTPASLTVKVGTAVTWTNNDKDAHTTTSTTGVWDSKGLSQGATFTYTFNTAGTFDYVCAYHSIMKGTITVTP